ncbi:MAG: hypothetical protein K0S11_692 [Gammaproteobacteria bacterium]|jgi:hypothetical protein|nr:hypothetical protein [Gammaproteobacteria bacterium]
MEDLLILIGQRHLIKLAKQNQLTSNQAIKYDILAEYLVTLESIIMNTTKALIIAISSLTIILSAYASTPSKIDTPLFIIRITSKQPQDIEGSYLAITNNDSKLIQIHQKTPFEVQVTAKAINAIIRTEPQNGFLNVQLLQLENGKEQPLVEGKGHAIIINNRSSECKNAFIVAR